VGRTLLSAVFDFDLAVDFDSAFEKSKPKTKPRRIASPGTVLLASTTKIAGLRICSENSS
jgi:hypothetical protein